MVTKKNRLWTLAAMALAITGFSSCLKNSDPTPPEPQSLIAFINGVASPAYGLDITQDGNKITSSPIPFGEAVGARFKPNTYKFDFKKGGADSLLNTITALYDTSAYNTLIVYGDQSTGIEVHRINEDFEDISRTKTNVRFYNLMTNNTEGVDVFIGSNKIWSSRYYGDFETGSYYMFDAVEPGTTAITVKDAAGAEIAVKGDAALTAVGGAYNIYLMGQKDSTGTTKPVIKVIAYQ